jgi:hypothetical protein
VGQIGFELPYGLPGHWEIGEKYPQGSARRDRELPLSVLLSQLLLAFALEFDGESHTPLILCANTLRVLSEKPFRWPKIPHLTGGSPETCGIGWQLKPYIALEPDPNVSQGILVRRPR